MSIFGYPNPDGPKYNTKRQYYLLAVPPSNGADGIPKDCYLCGICLYPVHKDDFTVDHIVGVPYGGKGWSLSNMQPSHKACNQLKGAIDNDIANWLDI